MAAIPDVTVLADAGALGAVLSPVRRALLQALRTPDSATGVARRLGLTRQKTNYHLRRLEDAGLVELVEERQRRGCTERVYRATSESYLVDPGVLGVEAQGEHDDGSAALLRVAARLVTDVGALRARAAAAGKPLLAGALEAEVRLESPAALRALLADLERAVASVLARHDRPANPGARGYRVVAGTHPVVTKTAPEVAREQGEADGTSS